MFWHWDKNVGKEWEGKLRDIKWTRHFIFGCHADVLVEMMLYKVDRHANVVQGTFSYE